MFKIPTSHSTHTKREFFFNETQLTIQFSFALPEFKYTIIGNKPNIQWVALEENIRVQG